MGDRDEIPLHGVRTRVEGADGAGLTQGVWSGTTLLVAMLSTGSDESSITPFAIQFWGKSLQPFLRRGNLILLSRSQGTRGTPI